MGAIMEFATEKQIESFLSTCHIEEQRNFLMAFKKKTWLKSFIDFFLQIIDQQKELIKEYQEDLTYKFKVLEKDIQTRLAVIKETQETEDK